jgi:hypothetical protein
MAIAVDARSAGQQGTGATVTWSHTVAGSDRILVVGGSIHGNGTSTLAVPTFGAASFTQYHTLALSSGQGPDWPGPLRVYLWYLLNPATGTDTITLTPTYAGIGRTQGSAISLTGVHQSSPFNGAGPHTQNTTNAQPSVVVTSAADQWALGVWSVITDPDPTPGVGSGQTAIGDHYAGTPAFMQHLFTDEDAGGSSVTLDYTGMTLDASWGVVGIGASLVPVGGGGGSSIAAISSGYHQRGLR